MKVLITKKQHNNLLEFFYDDKKIVSKEEVEIYEKVLNAFMPKKYSWWKKIKLINSYTSPLFFPVQNVTESILKLNGSLNIDSNWARRNYIPKKWDVSDFETEDLKNYYIVNENELNKDFKKLFQVVNPNYSVDLVDYTHLVLTFD